MNIKVRFTAPEDLDLIALVHSGVRMGLVIRDVLRAYVRQEIFYVPMPNTIKCINTENTSVNFILNSEKDGDVIAFLRSIRNGYKTVVIKNILRSYFTAPIMEPLKNDAFPIRVNLCWPDDLDLIILAQTQDMQELTLKALSAYVHKAKFSIDTPAIAASINADTMSFTLDLAQEADATISSFLFSIHPSARDNAIKNILRFYFQKPYIAPYLAQYTYNVQPSEHKERNITVAEKYFRPDALSNASAAAQVRPVRQTSAPKNCSNQNYFVRFFMQVCCCFLARTDRIDVCSFLFEVHSNLRWVKNDFCIIEREANNHRNVEYSSDAIVKILFLKPI